MAWLKTAYIAARYPNAPVRQGKGPSEVYESSDAKRAMTVACEVIHWAKDAEDLPFPMPEPSERVERMIKAVPAAAEFPPPECRAPNTPQLTEGVPPSQPLSEPKAPPPLTLRKCKQIQQSGQKQLLGGEIEETI